MIISKVALLTTTITLVGNVWIGLASILVNPAISNPINRDTPDNPTINLMPSSIFGKVEVRFGKNSSKNNLQCNDLKVVLFSRETFVKASNQVGSTPTFSNSNALTGDIKTGKCNYQVSADIKYIGKKAKLEFKSDGYTNSKPTSVTIPKKQLKLDKKVTLTKA